MTELLFREDAYLQEAEGRVTELTSEGGIVLDRTIFYPTGGGQPGDSGRLEWQTGGVADPQFGGLTIATAIKGHGKDIILIPAEASRLPPVGAKVVQRLDWSRRHRHMRVHTALHLLSVVLPLPVTGGAIGSEKGRLDFLMPDPPANKQILEDRLNVLIERDLVVSDGWISDEELKANPSLVKTMSVSPPMGQGKVRLVRIGDGSDLVDLQPCGGTHVARTSEIGRIRFGKIENKGKENRRVTIHLD
ncbi:alanyl-tRNA editing protein [Celeribacter neptunius]|uniref:Ala-tRNA(Pro) hydrolase n=1 Tax=Celeribacter neptunius TaxID=588602 RepID=A0A1I3K816_9RHOB|nr:alanyl-tRNA editing protein [Celeribacter neptunius]SFI68438.1 Ala-tRNA(Pro) hydrolase [Celeribacter neptunius]